MPKSYFATSSRDCSPDGPIALGSILVDPRDPEAPLSDRPIPIDTETVQSHDQYDVQINLANIDRASAGLFAKIFHSTGLVLSGSSSTRVQSSASIQRLQTLSFEPSDDYMKKSLSVPKVQQYLARYHMRKRVFVITGVKVAFGAKVMDTESHHGNVDASVGLDGDAIGIENDSTQHEEAIFMSIDDEDVTGEDLEYDSISVPEYGVIVDKQGEDTKTGQEESCELIIIK
ncbi:unnamed protein product [Fusarium venenatum]|uniref:Uncharacterized protein n=1 Tax=Fusarium venenatum TaxID=56646 RepID=A0A2L2TVZ9_9HYPO|nr:uncharacterized protein FVRRES_11028 [Fusarium venenatum]CEI70951.1 unnamed protein product [Fusarium venenatum]